MTPAQQLAGFISRFDPAIAALARAARVRLRRRFPTAVELVYDNYNALAIGWGPTERASDCHRLARGVCERGEPVFRTRREAGGSERTAGRKRQSGPVHSSRESCNRRQAGSGRAASRGNETWEDPSAENRSRLHRDQIGVGEAASAPSALALRGGPLNHQITFPAGPPRAALFRGR